MIVSRRYLGVGCMRLRVLVRENGCSTIASCCLCGGYRGE